MFKASLSTVQTMFKDQSESSSSKTRKELRTVIEETSAPVVIKTLKIVLLNLFRGERSKLKMFLLQIEMNICFNKLQFKLEADKVLYTATYLKNCTAKWFQSVLTNYLEQKVKNHDDNIIKTFIFF